MDFEYKLYQFRHEGNELIIKHQTMDRNIVENRYLIPDDTALADTSCLITTYQKSPKQIEYCINLQGLGEPNMLIVGIDSRLAAFLDNQETGFNKCQKIDLVLYLKKLECRQD